jgi:hypothetical protein
MLLLLLLLWQRLPIALFLLLLLGGCERPWPCPLLLLLPRVDLLLVVLPIWPLPLPWPRWAPLLPVL